MWGRGQARRNVTAAPSAVGDDVAPTVGYARDGNRQMTTSDLTVAGQLDDHVAELELLSAQIQSTQERIEREGQRVRADLQDLLRALSRVQIVMEDIRSVRRRWPTL